MDDLGRIVNAFLELAESRAGRIDKFLLADDRNILKEAGKITIAIAKDHAETEFEKYRNVQDRLFQSDFDKMFEDSK